MEKKKLEFADNSEFYTKKILGISVLFWLWFALCIFTYYEVIFNGCRNFPLNDDVFDSLAMALFAQTLNLLLGAPFFFYFINWFSYIFFKLLVGIFYGIIGVEEDSDEEENLVSRFLANSWSILCIGAINFFNCF